MPSSIHKNQVCQYFFLQKKCEYRNAKVPHFFKPKNISVFAYSMCSNIRGGIKKF